MSEENGVKANLNSVGPRLLKARLLFLAVLIIFPWFSACAKDAQPPKPPIVLPFAVQKAGNKVETEMLVVEETLYSFELRFMYKDQADRKRVWKLIGGAELGKDGKWIEPGILIPLRVIITQIEQTEERIIFEGTISEQPLFSWGSGSLNKQIKSITLIPGHYRISVETLEENAELEGVMVNLSIGHSYRGK